jgi:hypothetical protein
MWYGREVRKRGHTVKHWQDGNHFSRAWRVDHFELEGLSDDVLV